MADVDRLLDEAERRPFSGWDFSWLGDRRRVHPPAWDFRALVAEQARTSPDLLDMGTGGGEWLSRLPLRSPRTVAIEAWAPNVPIAARRLRRLGVPVVHVEGARDNVNQRPDEPTGRLPFRDRSFHLVSNRYEAYVPAEVARILVPGGQFLTQQVASGGDEDFCRLLGVAVPPAPSLPWNLAVASAQVEAAGLKITARGEEREQHDFADIGALAWYLKAIPWTVPGFSTAAFRGRLVELHHQIQATGPLMVRQPLFWLAACKSTR